MARTTHLSNKQQGRTQQTPKARLYGRKAREMRRRDRMTKYRDSTQRDDDFADLRAIIQRRFDWLVARGGDTSRIDKALEFIPGIGQLAEIRYDHWMSDHSAYNWPDADQWLADPPWVDDMVAGGAFS